VSKLTEFQILSVLRSCEATAARHEAEGKMRLAAKVREKAAGYRAELKERLDGMVARGERIPDQFGEVLL
jgi:hypothetical protein